MILLWQVHDIHQVNGTTTGWWLQSLIKTGLKQLKSHFLVRAQIHVVFRIRWYSGFHAPGMVHSATAEKLAYPTPHSTWLSLRRVDWHCSAAWWRTTFDQNLSKVCSGSDVLTAERFPCSFSGPSDEVYCYVSVTCLSSAKAWLSANVLYYQRYAGWYVRSNSQRPAQRGKVMARSSSEKEVPQKFLSLETSLSGDAHAFWDAQRRSEKSQNYASNKTNWK